MVLQFVGEYVVAFFRESLSEMTGFLVFYRYDVFALRARFVAFASPVRLKPRVFENPVANETGFFSFH